MGEHSIQNLTKDQIVAASQCRSAEELIAMAKTVDVDLTKEEAEAFLLEFSNNKLDGEMLEQIAGGTNVCYVVDGCAFKCALMSDN